VRARAEALLAYLSDVPIAILVANNRARYVDVNQQAVALTGYTRAELTSMGLMDLTPNPQAAMSRRLFRAFLRRGRMAGLYALRKDGSVVARAVRRDCQRAAERACIGACSSRHDIPARPHEGETQAALMRQFSACSPSTKRLAPRLRSSVQANAADPVMNEVGRLFR